MTILQILVPIIVVAIFIALVNRAVPNTWIGPDWKRYISWLAIVIVCIWLFQAFGGCQIMDNVRIGK